MSEIDYRYWASLDRWQSKEAALLIDGKDPDRHQGVRLNNTDTPEGYENAVKIAKLLSRTDWQQRYGYSPYQVSHNPAFIVKTLVDARWHVPAALLECMAPRLERLNAILAEESDSRHSTNATATTKERNTMLRLILGLACAGYGLDPEGARNPKAKEMREDLERVGIPLDDGTIKKYLDEAKRLHKRVTEGKQRT